MSISSAPCETASAVSCNLAAKETRPDGKPVATAATLMFVPIKFSFAIPTKSL